MKARFATIAVAMLLSSHAQAASVCYVVANTHVYTSLAFEYEGKEHVEKTSAAKSFFEFIRRQHGVTGTSYCSSSIYSVEQEDKQRMRFYPGKKIVNTDFRPASS